MQAVGETERNRVFELQLGAMLRAMNLFHVEFLCGESPQDVIAAEWIENGFEAKTVGLWWLARCFEPARAAELRDAGIDPRKVSPNCALGDTIGYHHSNCDLRLDEVQELIRQ